MHRVKRRMAGDAVVEIDVYIPRFASAVSFLCDLHRIAAVRCPFCQRFDTPAQRLRDFVGIIADIQAFTVQTDIKKFVR